MDRESGHVFALAIDPITPSTLYAGTRRRRLQEHGRGRDLGRGKRRADRCRRLRPGHRSHHAQHALRGDAAAAASSRARTRAPPGARQHRAGPMPPSPPWPSIPITPSTLYAGTDGGGVFKSTDAGATWSGGQHRAAQYSTSSPWPSIPTRPSTLYAGTIAAASSRARTRARPGARPTQGCPTAAPSLRWPSIPPRPARSTRGRDGGVFKSTDAGATWSAAERRADQQPRHHALAIDPTTPSTLYAGTERRRLQEHGRGRHLERG